MVKNKAFAAVTAFVSAITYSSIAIATTFQTDYNNRGIWSSFDTENDIYSLRFRSDLGKDGFYLVVTNGDNPKGDGDNYAILYGDRDSNRITAYTYDGDNNAESFQSGTLLGTFENAFVDIGPHSRHGYDQTGFNLDVSDINSAFGGDWKGIIQGPETGIWFHQTSDSEFTYGADGSIVDYAFSDTLYFDRGNDDSFIRAPANCTANSGSTSSRCSPTSFIANNNVFGDSTGGGSGGGSVPAPGGLAIVLIGLLGLGRMRSRSKA